MQGNFKKFDALFNQARKEGRLARREAVNTLSPAQIRVALKRGQVPQSMAVLIGSKADGSPFSVDDLRQFDKARKRLSQEYGGGKGAPVDQLIAASRAVDISRSNVEIRSARLYKVRGPTLSFNVTASGKNNQDFYQVRVRLEDWMQHMTGARTYAAATKKSVNGPISFDCTCGRHQFWYRYVATVGGFAIAPYEKDFPKVRNPNLTGCCCKHVLKALKTVKSPTLQAVLAREMKRQSSSAGFAGDTSTKFIGQEDHKKLDRARPGSISQESAALAYKKYVRAQQEFSSRVSSPELKKEMARLRRELKSAQDKLNQQKRTTATAKQKAKKALRSKAPASLDSVKKELRQQLDFGKLYGIPAKKIYANISAKHSMKTADVEAMARGL